MSEVFQPPARRRRVRESRGALWFGALGGGCAWLVHLVGAYVLAEFGCVGRLRNVTFLRLTAVAWLLLALSLATLLVALASTLTAYVRAKSADPAHDALRDAEADVDRAGWITSGLFLAVIFVESVPIFYYLRDC